MAISVFKTFSAGEVLTASDLNSSLTQFTNNAADLISPFTKNIAAGGFVLTGLGAGSANGESTRYEQWVATMMLSVVDFRLTLTTATPVTTADVSSTNTLYMSPYKGNRIALYDGTNWNVRNTAEISLVVSNAANGLYDIFCYDNSGTPTLEALIWTNDTTRATALTLQNGVLVKSGATTRRYMGTVRNDAAGSLNDTYAKRYVWNYYNRVLRPMRVIEGTDSWNYTTATVRQANGSAANQLDFVIGVSEVPVSAMVFFSCQNSTGGQTVYGGMGLDSTTTFAAGQLAVQRELVANVRMNATAHLKTFPGVGRHYLAWLEFSSATGTTTWFGDNGGITNFQTGIHGEIMG